MEPIVAVGWIILGGGLMALAAGIGMIVTTRGFVARAARADATVVVTEEALKNSATGEPSGFKAKSWFAEFKDRKGLTQRIHLGAAMDVKLAGMQLGPSEDKSLPPAGSKVAVLFDPANPIKVRRDTFRELWAVPAACIGMGIFCVAAVVVMRLMAAAA
jgi:hypothetical protein